MGEGKRSEALEVGIVPEKIKYLGTDNLNPGGVELSWSSSSAVSYLVYRSSNYSDKGSKIAEVIKTSFTDNDFQYEETYYYRVAGKNGATVGPVSDPLEVTTPSPPDIPIPIDLSSSYIESKDYILISWDYDDDISPGDDVYLYRDYSGNTNDGFEKIATLEPTVRSYTDQVFGTGVYTYKVEYFSNTYQYGEKSDPTSTFVDDGGGGDGPIIKTTTTSTYSEKEFNEIYWSLGTPDRDHQSLLKSIEIDNIILGGGSGVEKIKSTTPAKIRLESEAFDGRLDVEKEVSVLQSPITYSISIDVHQRLFYNSFEENDLNRWSSYSSELEDYQWKLSIISEQEKIVQTDRPYFNFEWCSNPLDPDTDGEGLKDGEEVETGTDPLFADTDNDGLNDHAELNDHDTDPLQYDTDKDGLSDGTEVESTGEVVLPDGTTKLGGLDPLSPDTDGDGVVDGEELNGYETVYITDSEEEETRQINDADPLTAYKDDDGGWMDTDSDNIPDVIEADPERMDDSRFEGLQNIEMIREFKERYEDEDSEFFSKQFNPYVRDTINPMALKCRAKNYLIWEKLSDPNAQAKVNIEFLDPSGIDYIKIKNKDQGNSKTFYEDDLTYDDGVAELNGWIPISYTNDYVTDGWDLGVKIVDTNGNVIEDSTHVECKLLGMWQDFTDWITEVVWGAADDAVSAASDMARSLVDWVKDKVSDMFSSVVNPIVDGLESWANTIQSKMDNFFTELSDWDDGDGDVDATMNAGTELMMSFVGQQDKAEQVTDVLGKVMNYIKPFQKYVSPMGAMGTIADSLGGSIPAVGNFFNMINDLKNKAISAGMEYFLKITEEVTGGNKEIPSSFGFDVPSMDAIENFLDASGLANSFINSVIDGVKDFLGNEQTGTVLGAIGMALTIITIISSTFASRSPTTSYILGTISIITEVTALMGSYIGISTVTQFFLGIIGTSMGGTALGLMIGKWIKTQSVNNVDASFTAIDFIFDETLVLYMLSLM